MASQGVNEVLCSAWREQWTAEQWAFKVNEYIGNLDSETARRVLLQLIGNILQYALSSPVSGGMYISYIKGSLATEQVLSADILEYICKNVSSQNAKSLPPALSILEYSLTYMRKSNDENDGLNLAVSLAKSLCWLFGAIAALLHDVLECSSGIAKDGDIQLKFNFCEKCFELIRGLMDNQPMQTLSLIGRLEIQEFLAEQEELIQTKLEELTHLPTDSLHDMRVSQQYDSYLKTLVNIATRFFTSNFHSLSSQSRKPGHVPSFSLQTLVEIQVMENLYMDSSLIVDLLDSVLRCENIPMDQFYVDLLRCGCHGILSSSNMQEELLWSSFFLFKIPSIVSHLRLKYSEKGLDSTVFITACIQFAKMNTLLDDLDVHCRFQCLPSFLAQCQQKGLLDAGNRDQILSQRAAAADLLDTTVKSDRNPLGNIINAGLLLAEVLKVLSLPLEENKDIIKQQLVQLSNSVELERQLAAATGMDVLSDFLDFLLSVNEKTKGPLTEPNEDSSFAEVRADIFHCSFLLLSYTTAVFGTKVLALVSNKDAFFVNWRLNCSHDVGQKRYPPMALEMILDQIMTNNTPNINAVLAKWDDYCQCSGAIINELTQALECSVILVDKIQRVCETFKNKRPALSICASAWLCTQYTSMTASKRDMIIKILRAFRGQKSQKPARSGYIARIVEDLAGTVDLEAPASMKTKAGCKAESIQRSPSNVSNMSQVLKMMSRFPGSPRVDRKSLNELKKNLEVLSPSGFCQALVMSILESGKIDEAIAFETLASTLMMLDPIKLFESLSMDSMPSILKRCDAFKLLCDPQGKALATFISKAVTYALVASKHQKFDSLQRGTQNSKVEMTTYRGYGSACQIVENLVSLIEDILLTLKWQQQGSITLFLNSLLEKLSETTMYLTPSIRLPQNVGIKLSKVLPSTISSAVAILIFNLEDVGGRKELAHRLCNVYLR